MDEDERPLRADTRRTREALLDAMGRLLEGQGLGFSLPDLAREAGVATATVYRHFDDVDDVRNTFYSRLLRSLVNDFRADLARYEGLELFEAVCLSWIQNSRDWARPATFLRSAQGYLERVAEGDPLVVAHFETLGAVVAQLVAAGEIPDQDPAYAVLVWITLFDERVIVDLETHFGWDVTAVTRRLAATVLAALRAQADPDG